MHPTTISKYNTALQLALIGSTTALPLLTIDVSTAMQAMQYVLLSLLEMRVLIVRKLSGGNNDDMEWSELCIYKRRCQDT